MSSPGVSASPSGPPGLEGEDAPNPHPSTVVAIKELGPPHSPWMWRQISTMRSLDLQIMYWMPADAMDVPAIGAPVHVLDADPTPYDGKGRWAFRAANLPGRNFFAARGKEAREIKSLIDESVGSVDKGDAHRRKWLQRVRELGVVAG